MITNALVCQAIYSKASLNSSNSSYFSKKKSNFINQKLDFNHERVMQLGIPLHSPLFPTLLHCLEYSSVSTGLEVKVFFSKVKWLYQLGHL